MVDGITDSMDMGLSKRPEIVKDKEAWCPAVHGVTKNWNKGWTSTLLSLVHLQPVVFTPVLKPLLVSFFFFPFLYFFFSFQFYRDIVDLLFQFS